MTVVHGCLTGTETKPGGRRLRGRSVLGPTSVLALYWLRTTRAGVMAGLVVGTLVTVVRELTPRLNALVCELIPAFATSTVVKVLVSLPTGAQPDSRRS